jgi:alkylation response protein AidB-like acyl-CoA dehydrogenase
MYSFEPSDEQIMLVETVSRFASGNLRPAAHDAEEAADLPIKLINKGWELGILQASIPEIYGGFGERSAMTGVLAAEEMAWGDLAGTLAVMTPGLFALPILLSGSDEQRQKYLPEVVEGDWIPNTSATIEPDFDFDILSLKTTAIENNDGFMLTGEKTLVPFANVANNMIVYANLAGKTQGFIVPSNLPGVTVVEQQKLLGIHALPVFRVKFDAVHVPAQSRLGGADGHDMAPILASSQLAMAALAVGLSRAALEYSRDYAKEREVFGMKVAQKQAIAFMIAEMATEIEAIRLLTWEAAWMMDTGKEDGGRSAYLAATGAADMAMMVTDRAVQILGGHGYIREHPVELWMRNGRGIAMLTGLAMV